MVWLQSHDRFSDVAAFDPATGQWEKKDKASTNFTNAAETSGFFSVLAGKFCALFVVDGQLLIRVGDTQTQLSDRTRVHVGGSRRSRWLSLQIDGVEALRHRYSVDVEPRRADDATPFTDDEDDDFGLLLSNVSASRERQSVLKRLA